MFPREVFMVIFHCLYFLTFTLSIVRCEEECVGFCEHLASNAYLWKCAWRCTLASECGSSMCISLQSQLDFKNTDWAGVHLFVCHRLLCITAFIPQIIREISDYWYLVITSSGLSTATVGCIMGCPANPACLYIFVFWSVHVSFSYLFISECV